MEDGAPGLQAISISRHCESMRRPSPPVSGIPLEINIYIVGQSMMVVQEWISLHSVICEAVVGTN